MRLRAVAPADGIAVGPEAGQDAGKPVAPGITGFDGDGQNVALLAPLHMYRPDHGVVERWVGCAQRFVMGIVNELMNLRIVAVVADKPGHRVIGLDNEAFALRYAKADLVPPVEGIACNL